MFKTMKYIFLLFTLAMFLYSCGAEVPKKEIAAAKKEIQRAENAQANDLDRENLEEAKTELQAAEKLVKDEKNEEAKKKALNSIVKARFAVKNSKKKLFKSKLDKAKELIAEAKRNHAHKIAETKYKSGVSKYEKSKTLNSTTTANEKTLTAKVLKTGDVVPKYENYIKDSDKGLLLATQAINELESALVDSKARIHKLEKNLAETSNLLNQLQRDKLIVQNFKDQLSVIRQKLNQANEFYKKFKFTDNTTEALNYLSKAEQLANEVYTQANRLYTEGRAKLQVLYKEKAKKALTEAEDTVKEAEKIYKNRSEPAGTRRNPYIPKNYKELKNKANTNTSVKRIAQASDSESTENSEPGSTEYPPDTNETKPSSEGSAPAGDSSSGASSTNENGNSDNPGSTSESTKENSPEPGSGENNLPPGEGTGEKKPDSTGEGSDINIEKELEQDGKKQKEMSMDEMYKRMKEKMKSADDKYKKGDYVGSWEDAEEAKRLAAKIKEKSQSQGATATNSGTSYKKFEIWKYYIVKYRRRNTDCLWRIALKLYGDATLWPIIWYANKLKIADPDVIFPRQKLAIPKVDSNRRK